MRSETAGCGAGIVAQSVNVHLIARHPFHKTLVGQPTLHAEGPQVPLLDYWKNGVSWEPPTSSFGTTVYSYRKTTVLLQISNLDFQPEFT